jgi:hypothetical protein
VVERTHLSGVVFVIVSKLHRDNKAHSHQRSFHRLSANGERGGSDDGGEPKRNGRLAEKRCYHYDEQALSSQTMRVSEDDKWYISDAANSALPALIKSFPPVGDTEADRTAYARKIGIMAHLIGVEMLLSRENTFAVLDQVIEEKENAEA